MENINQCMATTQAGTRCPNSPTEDGYCFTHSPAKEEERALARRKGGHNRKAAARLSGDNPPQVKSMADVLAFIDAIALDTWAQENGAARSRALIACADMYMRALSVTDFEIRLQRLEQAQKAQPTQPAPWVVVSDQEPPQDARHADD